MAIESHQYMGGDRLGNPLEGWCRNNPLSFSQTPPIGYTGIDRKNETIYRED